MAKFSHKTLLVVATVLFLSRMHGSEVKPYRYTDNYPTVTQMGMGTAAGLFGAGLSAGYGTPYVTGTAGAALTALLAKRVWDTAWLPEKQKHYMSMALGTIGGIGSGAILAKLLQNRGWNPYILAAAAAGTGALCGLGAEYGRKYFWKTEAEGREEILRNAEKEKREFIAGFSWRHRNLNLSHWRMRAKNLPLLTDYQRDLIENAYSEDQLVQIVQNRLPENIANELLGKSQDSWFSWVKHILKSPIDEQEREKRLNQVKDKLYGHLIDANLQQEAEMLKYLADGRDISKLVNEMSNFNDFIRVFNSHIKNNPKEYNIKFLLLARLDSNLQLIKRSDVSLDVNLVKNLLDKIIADVEELAHQSNNYSLPFELTELIEKYKQEKDVHEKIKQQKAISFWVNRSLGRQ